MNKKNRPCRECGKNIELYKNPKGRFSRRELCPACAGGIHATQGRMAVERVSKLGGGREAVVSLGGRPRTAVDMGIILNFAAQGWGYKAIASELTRRGQAVSYSTIKRRLTMHPCQSCGQLQANAEVYLGDEYFIAGIEQYEREETAQGVIWWLCINENCDRFWRKPPRMIGEAVRS